MNNSGLIKRVVFLLISFFYFSTPSYALGINELKKTQDTIVYFLRNNNSNEIWKLCSRSVKQKMTKSELKGMVDSIYNSIQFFNYFEKCYEHASYSTIQSGTITTGRNFLPNIWFNVLSNDYLRKTYNAIVPYKRTCNYKQNNNHLINEEGEKNVEIEVKLENIKGLITNEGKRNVEIEVTLENNKALITKLSYINCSFSKKNEFDIKEYFKRNILEGDSIYLYLWYPERWLLQNLYNDTSTVFSNLTYNISNILEDCDYSTHLDNDTIPNRYNTFVCLSFNKRLGPSTMIKMAFNNKNLKNEAISDFQYEPVIELFLTIDNEDNHLLISFNDKIFALQVPDLSAFRKQVRKQLGY